MHAEALRLLRKPADAVAELKQSLEQHPEDVSSYEEMAKLAAESPDVVDKPAAFWLDEAIAKNPQSALAYVARAGFYLRTKLREKAWADLEQAQKCDLPDTETRSRLVGTLLGAKLLDQAREQLKAWQTQDPAAVGLWESWAYLAEKAKVPEEMYMVAEAGVKALAAQPWDFLPTAAKLLIRSGHVEEAKSYIAQMQQKDIAPAAVLYLNAFVASQEGRLRDAVGDWRKAVALGVNARQPLARALAGLGDVQSAIGELRILVTETPNDAGAHLDLAKFLAQTRDWPGAMSEAAERNSSPRTTPRRTGRRP